MGNFNSGVLLTPPGDVLESNSILLADFGRLDEIDSGALTADFASKLVADAGRWTEREQRESVYTHTDSSGNRWHTVDIDWSPWVMSIGETVSWYVARRDRGCGEYLSAGGESWVLQSDISTLAVFSTPWRWVAAAAAAAVVASEGGRTAPIKHSFIPDASIFDSVMRI